MSERNHAWLVERKLKSGRWAVINQGSHFNGTYGNGRRRLAEMRHIWPEKEYRLCKYEATK